MSSMESHVENGLLEEEQTARKRKISLSRCGVCRSKEANYRCPACLAHSCSLLCVKKHKDDSGCSGVRNKTAFVALSYFDEMNLLSDYRFLEDTGRFADGTTRDHLIRAPRVTLKAKKLICHARKMNITLRFLPVTFTKSKENSTFFLAREKLFLWHLKLIFPQSNSEFSQRRVSDTQTLKQILTAYIHPTESDPVTRQKLKMYVHAPFEDVRVFMKAEGRKANSVRYHELETEKSLRENLSYKTVIEYPVLHVALRDHWKDYPLKGPAESVSTCKTFATLNKEDACGGKDPASIHRSHTPERIKTQESTPETEPPLEKRAKRGGGQDELEEGEIMDSSEDENCSGNLQCDDAKSPFENALDEIVNAAAMAGMVSEVTARPSEDVCTSRGSTEVSVDKEAPEELGPVCTRHCQDGNESADEADITDADNVADVANPDVPDIDDAADAAHALDVPDADIADAADVAGADADAVDIPDVAYVANPADNCQIKCYTQIEKAEMSKDC